MRQGSLDTRQGDIWAESWRTGRGQLWQEAEQQVWGLGGRNGFGSLRTREKAPGWLALISQEEEAKTEGEHIRGKLGWASPPPRQGWIEGTWAPCGEELSKSSSHPDGMGCSGRQRSAQSPKFISAVLENVVPNSSGLKFGFTIILITYCLVRVSPSLQPGWLFPGKCASDVLIRKPGMKLSARAGLRTAGR